MRALRSPFILAAALLLASSFSGADQITVRHVEGVVHGFLTLRTTDGALLADGDLEQTAAGNRVTSRVSFRFKDGSLHDETAVYSQRGHFRLITDHLIQKGPSFPHPVDVTISADGHVAVRYAEDGKQRIADEQLALPQDLANGLTLTLLKNLGAGVSSAKVTMVAATPKPRVVTLVVSRAGEDTFSAGSSPRKATHYVVRVDIGGLKGLIAPLVGKQPPDTHVWILSGDIPAFVKSEGPMYYGGPVWRIELTSPVWSAR